MKTIIIVLSLCCAGITFAQCGQGGNNNCPKNTISNSYENESSK